MERSVLILFDQCSLVRLVHTAEVQMTFDAQIINDESAVPRCRDIEPIGFNRVLISQNLILQSSDTSGKFNEVSFERAHWR